MEFTSQITEGSDLTTFTTQQVKDEPMLWRARGDYAWEHGGPLTRNFLTNLAYDRTTISVTAEPFCDVIIDSRVHMLMKDWYPCIPGFHHDDVPRIRFDGQPYYPENEDERMTAAGNTRWPQPTGDLYRSKHAMGLYGDDICCTEFALGTAPFTPLGFQEILYREWHPEVVAHLETGVLTSYRAPMHKIVHFDDRSWHQGVPSTGAGWRFFIRASWSTDVAPENQIRRQTNVYLENPMEGW